MIKLLQLLLAYKFKVKQPNHKTGGFTLIELLVGLVLAFLIITPLLGFVVNMLQTDRQEQAKATSEQEIQAALDYIARDMEQAVYIYDGYGLRQIQSKLPQPTDGNSTPVLVFWKRQFLPEALSRGGTSSDDAFVYALVVYYIRKSNSATCATSPWSCTAQITRVQLRDALPSAKNQSGDPTSVGGQEGASPGFRLFKPDGQSSVEASMNAWPPTGATGNINDNQPEVLIDYIDQTPLGTAWCPPIKRNSPPTGIDAATYEANKYQQVPAPGASGTSALAGFFACVDLENTSATIAIRGNALARIRSKSQQEKLQYVNKESVSSYFPSARIEVKGRGVFTINRRS